MVQSLCTNQIVHNSSNGSSWNVVLLKTGQCLLFSASLEMNRVRHEGMLVVHAESDGAPFQ